MHKREDTDWIHSLNADVGKEIQRYLDLHQSGIGKYQDCHHKMICVTRITHLHHPDEEQVDAKTRVGCYFSIECRTPKAKTKSLDQDPKPSKQRNRLSYANTTATAAVGPGLLQDVPCGSKPASHGRTLGAS